MSRLMYRSMYIALASLALAIAGCHAPAAENSERCACAEQGVVDAALLAFLSKARAAHHGADLAIEKGDARRAIRELERVTYDKRSFQAPEAAEVLADTHARLADLKSEIGDYAAAMRDVEAGLELATTPTHFRGHLFEVKGIVLEREAKSIASRGDERRATELKERAMEAFEAAIRTQDQVIDFALGGAPSPSAAPSAKPQP